FRFTTLTIVKAGNYSDFSSIDPNQTFVFSVIVEGADGKPLNIDVTIHGNSSVTIDGLTVGNQYTITEKTDWSWRYKCNGWSHDVNKVDTGATDDIEEQSGTTNIAPIILGVDGTITFTNNRNNQYWLDGDSWCDNRFAGVSASASN
ncbi:MAG: hypothetical protein IJB44_01750, partial [Clostridia bacterium]|nr:hypothetical protein [Clostridia bacterium]